MSCSVPQGVTTTVSALYVTSGMTETSIGCELVFSLKSIESAQHQPNDV